MKFVMFLIMPILLYAVNLDFTLHKKGEDLKNNVLLVVGGIQGDEPGGFNAASLLVTHYKIKKGSVWVVPNLNFGSIVERSRGLFGDMNRKFANLSKNDPEFGTVERIKSIIKNSSVEMVLNLHDGSGFYRDTYIDKWRNPYKWGQSCIIDQAKIENKKYGNLLEIANSVKEHVNNNLDDKEHVFGVKNTRTSEGDKEMAKTLTYYAILNNKPAFGIEGSKNFDTHYRAYYHLLALEKYMQIMGIEYERNLEMSPLGIKQAIDENELEVVLYENKLLLPVKDARNYLHYIPMKKNSSMEYTTDHPLVAVVEKDKKFRVCYGNRRKTLLYPQFIEYDDSINSVDMNIDGYDKVVPLGSIVNVNDDFLVKNRDGYRVNIIGFTDKNKINETDLTVNKKSIAERFSIDKNGNLYRVEIYKDKKFSGMILVNFDGDALNESHKVASLRKYY